MTELDQVWARMLDTAAEHAGKLGRDDIVEYLRLKATNDAIRAAGVTWLFDTIIGIGLDAQKRRPHITIERIEPHRFNRGNSRMVGAKLEIRQGVRCLTVEAGWTRSPGDGVMRGQALAVGAIIHFGIARKNAELKLVRGDELPRWLGAKGLVIDSGELRRHFALFLDD
jgi:hypothetical protein